MTDELRNATLATDRSSLEGPLDRAGHSKRAQVRNAELLAAALAMIAGFIDAYGMITYGVFVSFMSGNTTQTGYQTAEGAFGPASLSALAILFFVVGSFAATLLAQVTERRARAPGLWRGRSCAGRDCQLDRVRGAARQRRHRVDKFRDGDHEQRALSRRRAGGQRHVRDWRAKPPWCQSRARAETRSASGLGGAVGHPSAAGGAAWPPLARRFWLARWCRARPRRGMARRCF